MGDEKKRYRNFSSLTIELVSSEFSLAGLFISNDDLSMDIDSEDGFGVP